MHLFYVRWSFAACAKVCTDWECIFENPVCLVILAFLFVCRSKAAKKGGGGDDAGEEDEDEE